MLHSLCPQVAVSSQSASEECGIAAAEMAHFQLAMLEVLYLRMLLRGENQSQV